MNSLVSLFFDGLMTLTLTEGTGFIKVYCDNLLAAWISHCVHPCVGSLLGLGLGLGGVETGAGGVETGAGGVETGAGRVETGAGRVETGAGGVETGAGRVEMCTDDSSGTVTKIVVIHDAKHAAKQQNGNNYLTISTMNYTVDCTWARYQGK